MATVEALVVQYQHVAGASAPNPANIRRRQPDKEGEPELELRFEDVDFEFTEQLLDKMFVAVKSGEFERTHAQTLNSLRGVAGNKRGVGYQQVWQLYFKPDGGRENTYYRKERLANPVRIRSAPGVIGYKVVLSQETPIDPFPTDDLKFRIKNRVSFTAKAGCAVPLCKALEGWRLDVTIALELPNSSLNSLARMTKTMFGLGTGPDGKGTIQTPETMLEDMELRGTEIPTAARLANRQQYHFEVELEYVGNPANLKSNGVGEAAGSLIRLTNPDFLVSARMQTELRDIASYISESPGRLQRFASGELGLKQLAPQAFSLTRGEYADMYPPVGMFLTDKAHGIHAMVMVRDGRLVVIAPGLERLGEKTQKAIAEFYIEGVGTPTLGTATSVPAVADKKAGTTLTILDGELVPTPKPTKNGFPYRFLAFDVLAVKGAVVAQCPFEERVTSLEDAVEELLVFISAQAKPFIHLTSADPVKLETQFRAMYHRADRDYENDGLVLYGPGERYDKTTIKKWKPMEENSIDFLARRPPRDVLGVPPFIDRPGHQLYFLSVGISQEKFNQFGLSRGVGYDTLFPAHSRTGGYFPVYFQPSDQPYAYLYHHPNGSEEIENQIIEVSLLKAEDADGTPDSPAPLWVLNRVRFDREEDLRKGRLFGNNFRTAEFTWLNYRDPLEEKMLWAGPGGAYFSAPKMGIYTAPTKFMSTVKSNYMRAKLAGSRFVVDLGAGKGQDLGRYRQNNVGAVVMVDQDAAALSELVRRKHDWASGSARRENTRFHVLRADFTAPHAGVAAKLRAIPGFPRSGADAVVCNLAAHYAFSSADKMANFVDLVSDIVRPGGQVFFVLLDGQRVLNLLNENKVMAGQTWALTEGGVRKYAIKRMFREKTLTAAGQKIAVLLPFSRGELYEEYVSNIMHLKALFLQRGFSLQKYSYAWMENDHGTGGNVRRSLTPADIEWLKLFAVIQFERKGE
jgi:hypothetical protein